MYFQKKPPEVFCKKKVFLEIPQNSRENTCVRVSFLINQIQYPKNFYCEFQGKIQIKLTAKSKFKTMFGEKNVFCQKEGPLMHSNLFLETDFLHYFFVPHVNFSCSSFVLWCRQKQPSEVFNQKKVFLKISQNSQGNTCARVLFFIKVVKHTLFTEQIWTTASLQVYI